MAECYGRTARRSRTAPERSDGGSGRHAAAVSRPSGAVQLARRTPGMKRHHGVVERLTGTSRTLPRRPPASGVPSSSGWPRGVQEGPDAARFTAATFWTMPPIGPTVPSGRISPVTATSLPSVNDSGSSGRRRPAPRPTPPTDRSRLRSRCPPAPGSRPRGVGFDRDTEHRPDSGVASAGRRRRRRNRRCSCGGSGRSGRGGRRGVVLGARRARVIDSATVVMSRPNPAGGDLDGVAGHLPRRPAWMSEGAASCPSTDVMTSPTRLADRTAALGHPSTRAPRPGELRRYPRYWRATLVAISLDRSIRCWLARRGASALRAVDVLLGSDLDRVVDDAPQQRGERRLVHVHSREHDVAVGRGRARRHVDPRLGRTNRTGLEQVVRRRDEQDRRAPPAPPRPTPPHSQRRRRDWSSAPSRRAVPDGSPTGSAPTGSALRPVCSGALRRRVGSRYAGRGHGSVTVISC